ncbi:hypothetical protein LIER_25246 [Lithospermum erythrorhizon]|uniref:Uncharacterized protein n=1 Tax=Lithospermum erythrorhizon TaxID=34254 RepID=A0AAV3R7B4_LITER
MPKQGLARCNSQKGAIKVSKKTTRLEKIQMDMGKSSKKRPYEPMPQKGLVHRRQTVTIDRLALLRVSIAEVFAQLEDKNLLPKPVRMRSVQTDRIRTATANIIVSMDMTQMIVESSNQRLKN